MAYIHQDHIANENELIAEQRGKRIGIKISKMPFVGERYYKRWGTV